MKHYIIVFYNRFACQTQIFRTDATSKIDARHKFWDKYDKKKYYNCIELIEEV